MHVQAYHYSHCCMACLCCPPVDVADQGEGEQIEDCKYELSTSNQRSSFSHMVQNGVDVHEPCRVAVHSGTCGNRDKTTL